MYGYMPRHCSREEELLTHMMRYLYIGLVVSIIVGVTVFFVYKTSDPRPDVLYFGGVSLKIEYATSIVAKARGLGGRESIQSDVGMLFVFAKDDTYGFWMKDMLIPIDIFWLNERGQVIWTAQDVATSSYPNVFYPSTPARYVLETSAGFARAHGIATGTPLLLKNIPSVSE